jgi:hypothetical protein
VDPRRWQKVQAIFEEALDQNPELRAGFLEQA